MYNEKSASAVRGTGRPLRGGKTQGTTTHSKTFIHYEQVMWTMAKTSTQNTRQIIVVLTHAVDSYYVERQPRTHISMHDKCMLYSTIFTLLKLVTPYQRQYHVHSPIPIGGSRHTVTSRVIPPSWLARKKRRATRCYWLLSYEVIVSTRRRQQQQNTNR